MADGASRLVVATHPVAVGALVVLAVNDHVLKGWSGTVEGTCGVVARTATGKASDLAGVLLLAVWLGALGGRRHAAVALVAIGFAALKVSPLVAELAVPVLGGRTRTDPSDLLALLALVPADRILRPLDRAPRPDLRPAWASLRSTLGLAVVVVSVPAMTATSPCDDEGMVGLHTVVIGDDEELIVWEPPRRHEGYGGNGEADATELIPETWWTSDDAGATWREGDADRAVVRAAMAAPIPLEACTDEGCFRSEGDRIVVEGADGDVAGFGYSDGQRERMRANEGECDPPMDATVGEIVAVDGTVVATAGRWGVVRRPPGGDWEQVSVGPWEEPSTLPSAWPRHLTITPFIAAAAYALLFWLSIVRNPKRSLLRPLSAFLVTLSVVLFGGFGLLAVGLDAGRDRHDGLLIGQMTAIGFVLGVLPLIPLLLGYGGRAPRADPPTGWAPPMGHPGPPRDPGDPGPPPPGPSGWI
jgi:hypothetical protein